MGEIDSLFWRYAQAEDVRISESEECRALNRMFSQSVDRISAEESSDELERLRKQAPTIVDHSRVWLRMQREGDAFDEMADVSPHELSNFMLLQNPIPLLLQDEEVVQLLDIRAWESISKRNKREHQKESYLLLLDAVKNERTTCLDLSKMRPCGRIPDMMVETHSGGCDYRCTVARCRKVHPSPEKVVLEWQQKLIER